MHVDGIGDAAHACEGVIPKEMGSDYKDKVGAAFAGKVCRQWIFYFIVLLRQMLWWGMDETLVELLGQAFCC